ncbi:MAG: hypothetical protein ACP5GZ_03005 [Vulcanisaeta sp.]|uniref:hypothetical protein n=1 Tax=Vulcanisaeta sp. TaxID=2020871 RepID=UPI003D0FE6FA
MSLVQVDAGKLRICWGVRRGKRLVCKEPVADEAVIREVLELVEELKRRVEKHKDKLGGAAFIDELIDLLEQWLEEHKNDKGKKIKEAKKIARKMIKLLKKLRRKWVEKYWRQLLELMDLLEKNATDIIVTGENNSEKSLTVHLYNRDVAIEVDKVAKSGNVTISLSLSKLEGDNVKVANTFSDKEALRAIQHGWGMTDGGITSNHPAMNTAQPWQAVLWSLCYPGKIHILINGIGINEEDITVIWHLVANDHRTKPKEDVAKEVKKLGTERLKAFLAPAIWGDGYINANKKSIRLIMGLGKYDLWLGIVERLINELGFTIYPREYSVEVMLKSSKAVKLARDWLAMQDVKELIELGAGLPDGEKFRRIIELASKDVREKGSSSIAIPGTNISMSISIGSDCRVELRTKRKSEDEALRLVEELRRAGYEPSMYVVRGGYMVSITHANIRDSPLKPIVCRKLGEWLEGEKDERRKERIAMAMQNLKCLDNT